MSAFDALLEEIGQMQAAPLAKAEGTADDKKIAAAAGAEGANGESADADADDKKKGEGEGCEGEKPMAKAFTLKLEDGSEVEAVDATALLKALNDRVDGNETAMVKAVTGLVAHVKSQGELIKSLQGDLQKLGNEGRGRKAVVTINEKPAPAAETLAKGGEPEGVSAQEFFAKAHQARAEGRITGEEISRAEAYLGRGLAVPAEIVNRVLSK